MCTITKIKCVWNDFLLLLQDFLSFILHSVCFSVDFGTLLSCADANDICIRYHWLAKPLSSVTGRGSNEEEPISSFRSLN